MEKNPIGFFLPAGDPRVLPVPQYCHSILASLTAILATTYQNQNYRPNVAFRRKKKEAHNTNTQTKMTDMYPTLPWLSKPPHTLRLGLEEGNFPGNESYVRVCRKTPPHSIRPQKPESLQSARGLLFQCTRGSLSTQAGDPELTKTTLFMNILAGSSGVP